MAKNKNLTAARLQKNDEFYTLLSDIDAELEHYTGQLKGKTVYCNCDNPAHSNFWRYLHQNFSGLGLKKLVSTYFCPINPSFKTEYTGGDDENICAGTQIELTGNGDFRSNECIEILEKCDVVISNPPFSLAREYIAQLISSGKQFIIINSMNSITYKEVFPLLKENRMWIGYTKPKQFLQPDGSLKSFGNILWYTNIDIQKRHNPIPLNNRYEDNPTQYPRYTNYNGIECSKVSNIPADYSGHIGVPITFLEKYCPEQFEIVGISRELGRPMAEIAEKGTYEQGGIRFYLPATNEQSQLKYHRLYDRIVIRHKNLP